MNFHHTEDRRMLADTLGRFIGEQMGFEARMAVNLSTKLQRLAGGVRTIGTGMENRAAITKSGHAGAIEQVRINSRDLGRGVGAQTQGATGELVHQLESLQAQSFAGARQQRLQVFKHGRHDQLVAIATGTVEQQAPELFNVPGL